MSDSRAPLRQVPPWACAQRMAKGEARRWVGPGKVSYCYVLACPGCGRASMHTMVEAGFVEGAMVTSRAPLGPRPESAVGPYEHPTTLAITRPVRCPYCGGTLRTEGGDLVSSPMVPAPK